MKTLSIIIVSWNTRALLKACLESVYASLIKLKRAELEIWVVDNQSTDGSAEMVADHFPEVNLIRSPENLGFAGGNNAGLRQAGGKYILLLNPDTVVQPGGLDLLVDFLEAHPRSGAAGSRYLNPDGSLQISTFPFPTVSREIWRLLHLDRIYAYGIYDVSAWPLDTPHQVDIIQGASFMVRKAVLDQIGLMDERYFMYTEEIDLCYRIYQAGWEITWVPGSQVVHYGGQSTVQVGEKMFLCLYQSKLQFFRKFYGPVKAAMYKGVLYFASLLRVAMSFMAYLEKGEKRQRHLQLAQNYRRLIADLPGW
ncbi:MAG: glycosyltransferase family 2 protein [Anaerolineales bacterium]